VTDASPAPDHWAGLDTGRPHSARMWNHLLGGKDNFATDREAAARIRDVFPEIVDIARADRAFLRRVVRHLITHSDVRQFLDIGAGLPTMDNTHEIAQRLAPESRIVYVDNDPLVLVYARALMAGSPEGSYDYVEADVCEPDKILDAAARTLDLRRPVAILLLGLLHYVPRDAHRIVRLLLDTAAPGSFLVITHASTDLDSRPGAQEEAQRGWNTAAASPITARTRSEIERFFDGTEPLEPGVVSMTRWRPDVSDDPAPVPGFGGVGHKVKVA